MKFKKNIISLGASSVCSARAKNDTVEFFMSASGVVVKKTFDLAANSLKTDAEIVSCSTSYLALEKGAVEDIGGLIYAKYK